MLPIVFLPGLLSDKRIWRHQEKHLKNDFPIQIVELFHGNSTQSLVNHVLSNSPSIFSLVGHSMGGWLALEIMKSAPERVKKLCLLNTTAKPDTETKKNFRLQMLKWTEEQKFEEVIDTFSKLMVFNQEIVPVVKNMMREVGKKIFISQEEAMLNRVDSRSILPQIMCPSLIIHSSDDKIFKLEDHLELVQQIPFGKLAVVNDCGHMTPLEQPQALTTLLRFWLENN